MKKSALQTARASYQPKLPEAIKHGVTIVEGKATQSVADQEAIAKLFPNTYGMPVLRFEAAAKKEYPAMTRTTITASTMSKVFFFESIFTSLIRLKFLTYN